MIVINSMITLAMFLCIQLTALGQNLIVVVAFYIFCWLSIVWLCTSFWVLFDAFRRIKRISIEAKLNIDTKMVRLHLFTYAAFLVTLLLFFAALLDVPEKVVIICTLLFSVASFTSQLGLVYIFN